MLNLPPKVYGPPAYGTTDWQAAFRSVNVLAQLDPRIAATGHGLPLYGEKLRRGLEKIAGRWDAFVASRGRYVNEPAVADEEGVKRVPPPVLDVKLTVYSAIGLAALAGAIYWRAVRVPKPRTSWFGSGTLITMCWAG